MKVKMLLLLSIIGFFSAGVHAEAATGLCKDGTEYTGASKRGACRGHKGLKEWYAEKTETAAEDTKTKSKKSTKEKATKEDEAASGPATGVCKDGYVTSGTNKRSACRGHDGIKEWYADKGKEEAKPDKKAAKEEPAATGATTGLCKDGTEYTGASKRGACRGHGGVKEWYADKEKTSEKEPAPAKAEPAAASGTATGLCKDGTEYTGASKRGACRGHKGLKEWYADTEESDTELTPPESKDTSAKKADTPAKPRPAKPAAGSGKVWVNTKSKIYHCEESRFYGNTIEGEYMSASEAEAQGFRANRHQECK